MADGINADFSEITKLAADLSAAPAKATPFIRKAIEVTARHVKDDWREPLKGSDWLPHGPFSISYDITVSKDEVEAEIGPELTGQGPLVGMLEYGTPSTGPTGFGHAALQKNEADFADGLGKALGDAL